MKSSLTKRYDYSLWVRLHQTAHAVEEARQRELSKVGLSVMKCAALFLAQVLGNNATPAEISRWILREPHTVTSLVNRMEKEGLVTKVKDLGKKNLVRVVATERGRQAYEKTTRLNSMRSIRNILSALSEAEQEQLHSYLERLLRAAIKQLDKNSMPGLPRDFSR